MDDSETCPNCRTSKYNKPNMKLMINVCAHPLCESCVEQLFFRGSGPCYRCGRILKKNDFRDQVFEDTYIEKEVQIRKKYLKDLVRHENEFPSLREFNDYLEAVENISIKLSSSNSPESLNEEGTMKKLDELKKEAKESAKNRTKMMIEVKRENPLFSYKPLEFIYNGPIPPSTIDILQTYAKNIPIDGSQLSSGFPAHVPAQRIMNDSFNDLYVNIRGERQTIT